MLSRKQDSFSTFSPSLPNFSSTLIAQQRLRSTSTKLRNETIGTAHAVQLLFWSPAWNTGTLASLAASIIAGVKSILFGPYMSGLRQYGVKRCFFGRIQSWAQSELP
jgi:hypothetical protein